jgi:hypothetical protein
MPIANTTIRIKKSVVSGNIPSTLANGEIAINSADGKLYYATPSGSIAHLTNSQSFATINANSSLILATSPTDTLSIVGANGIGITANTSSKTVTIGHSGNSFFPSIVNVNYTAGAGSQNAAIQVTGANTKGGIGYLDFLWAQNQSAGANNSSKYFRLDSNGQFQIINSAYNQNIFNLNDTGYLTVSSIILNSGSGGSITFQDGTTQSTAASGSTFDTYARTTANAAFDKANSANILAQGAFTVANSAQSNTVITQGVDSTQNTWISSNAVFVQAAFTQANTANNTANIAATNITVLQSVNLVQNTTIGSAFDKANSANILSQSAFNQANTANTRAYSTVLKTGDTMTGQLTISNTNISTNTTTGALIVSGGVGIAGNTWSSGKLSIGNSLSHVNLGNVLNTAATSGVSTYRAINLIDTVASVKIARLGGNPSIELQEWDSNIANLTSYWEMVSAANSIFQIRERSTGTSKAYLSIFQANGSVYLLSNTISTNTSTGSLIINGGLGANGNIYATAVYSNNALVLTSEPIGQGAFTFANTVNTYAYSANTFLQANDASTLNTSQTYTNTTNTAMKAYVDQANTGMASYVVASNTAMKAYVDQANTGLKSYTDATHYAKTGGTISGSVSVTNDLTVSGNLIINGISTTINTSSIVVNDPLIFLGNNNFISDTVDIGIIGHYNSTQNAHTGVFRDATLKEWFFFQNYTPEIRANNLINIADPTFVTANVYGGFFKGNLVGNTATVGGIELGAYSQAAYSTANSAQSNTVTLQGVNTTQNTWLSSNAAFTQSAYTFANTVNTYSYSAYSTANSAQSNTVALQGVNTSQNTWISSNAVFTQSAFTQANSANILAQGAFTFANTRLANTGTSITVNGSSQLVIANTSPSTSNITGALVVSGGLGVAGNVNVTGSDSFFGGEVTISANTTSDALRITQTGTGNALLVEDSANPDSTPFVINTNGVVIQDKTTARTNYFAGTSTALFQGSTFAAVDRGGAFDAGPAFILSKNRGATGDNTVVVSGDTFGQISFQGADGTNLIPGAAIAGQVDGTPGTNDMPGRLVFSTTADGASSPTERMRIDSAGRVGIGSTSLAGYRVRVGGVFETTGTTGLAFAAETTIPSNVTGSAYGFYSAINTAASAFTLGNLHHYRAVGQTPGAGSTVTNQFGFYADSGLTGATNNYGFYSNIASGTGRWNFYANGTANNYFAGNVGIGTTALSSMNLRVSGDLTGSASTQAIRADGVVQSDSTSAAIGVYTLVGTAAAAFTVSNLYQYRAEQGTFGAGSTVTNQYGYLAGTTLIGATNNYGFYGNIAAGTNRYNFYANGTAANYFAGALSLGASPSAVTGSLPVNISYNLTGATSVTNIRAIPSILSDVTGNAIVFKSNPFTQAAAFTLGGLIHYDATQGTIGAGSAVVNQYGFNAAASLIGATNNYGFFSSIPSGTGRFNFYANGTAANVFAGTTSIGGAVGSESLRVTPTASAVNFVTIQGSVTGGAPTIFSAGSDTNIGLLSSSKGTGSQQFYTNGFAQLQFLVSHTASAVNYLQVTGNATTGGPILSAQGSDTNVSINYTGKGTGGHVFSSGNVSNIQFVVSNTTSAVNYLQVTGAAAGSEPAITAQGTDSVIDIILTPKGTGGVGIGTSSPSSKLEVNGTVTATAFSGRLIGPELLDDVSGLTDSINCVFTMKLDDVPIANTYIVDSKDLQVTVDGRILKPYVEDGDFIFMPSYDAYKGFRVRDNRVIIYNAPEVGSQIGLVAQYTSTTKQIRRYPFSATNIGLGD